MSTLLLLLLLTTVPFSLIAGLLNGLAGLRFFSLTNFESILLSVLKKYNVEQLFLQSKESNQWSELTMLTKLDIIYTLCEFRLQLGDVELKITVSCPLHLNLVPLGPSLRLNGLSVSVCGFEGVRAE